MVQVNLQAGADIFGGWEFEARARFIELRDKIRIAKSRPHVHGVEEEALKLLRKKLQLKEKKETKGPKTGASFAGKVEELKDFMEDLGEEVEIGADESSDIEEITMVPPPPRKRPSARPGVIPFCHGIDYSFALYLP